MTDHIKGKPRRQGGFFGKTNKATFDDVNIATNLSRGQADVYYPSSSRLKWTLFQNIEASEKTEMHGTWGNFVNSVKKPTITELSHTSLSFMKGLEALGVPHDVAVRKAYTGVGGSVEITQKTINDAASTYFASESGNGLQVEQDKLFAANRAAGALPADPAPSSSASKTVTVNINVPGRQSKTVNVVSQTDANNLTSMLGYQHGNAVSNLVNKMDEPTFSATYISLFNQIWNDPEKLEDVKPRARCHRWICAQSKKLRFSAPANFLRKLTRNLLRRILNMM